jgi:hypothetical protein
MRSRSAWIAAVVVALGGATAHAQPAPNPYDDAAPTPAPAPAPTATPAAEQVVIAKALVERARQLLNVGFYDDAIVLAEEALLEVADGDVAAEAHEIIRQARAALGPQPRPEPIVTPPEPVKPDPEPQQPDPEGPIDTFDPRAGARLHLSLGGMVAGGALFGGIALASYDSEVATAVSALGAAAAGGVLGNWLAKKYEVTKAQARTITSGAMIGAVTGGLFADVIDVDGSSTGEIALGVGLGSLVGVGGGIVAARADQLSTGDVAIMDSFALYGIAGGLALGAAMQPAEDEAYSLNAVLGGAGGWVAGALLGPKIDASPRRVAAMALGALALGGAPWLVYLGVEDGSTTSDEQAIGFASSVGIVAGAYLGYRFSGKFAGEEVGPNGVRVFDDDDAAARDDNSATALLRRSARGGWSLGPAIPRVAPVEGGRAWVLDLAAGAF